MRRERTKRTYAHGFVVHRVVECSHEVYVHTWLATLCEARANVPYNLTSCSRALTCLECIVLEVRRHNDDNGSSSPF